MRYTFRCKGHENMLGTHANTLEFTKDKDLTRNGDCIIGMEADFNLKELKGFIEKSKGKEITCIIEKDCVKDEFAFLLNPSFDDDHEMVIRKTDFLSKRTLGIHASKAAIDLNRGLITKDKNSKIKITFTS